MAIWLILAHFHQNGTILKIWFLYKRSMTFSYFVLYLDNATSYGYHLIGFFFTPYDMWNTMACIITKLKHFEFSSAWGGLSASGGLCAYVFQLWYPWDCRVGTPWGIFLHRWDKNNRWSHAMSCLLPGYMFGKRRPKALLWYQLDVWGLVFKFTGGCSNPLGKLCYRQRHGLVRRRLKCPWKTLSIHKMVASNPKAH